MTKIELTPIGTQVLAKRYELFPGESWEECAARSAKGGSLAESLEDRQRWEKEFLNIIYPQDFIPGGRIVYSSGRIKPAGMNCFGLGVEDSREAIGKLFADFMVISSSGGGVGINFSKLRPKGDLVKGVGGESSGVLSWMHVINSMGDEIKAGGSRRMACMALLSIDHPEIESFITAKIGEENKNRYNNMNLSVLLNSNFINAVKNKKMFPLTFRGKTYKEIDAETLWKTICKNAVTWGEPGILHEDNIRYWNNLEYFQPFTATNPCGEITLGDKAACCLGSINLSHMWKNRDGVAILDKKKLKKTVGLSVRFLDNIIETNAYPTPEAEVASKAGRRLGLGYMGLHHLLIRLKIPYGSPESIEFMDVLGTIIRNEAYKTSVELAKEKGAFPEFNVTQYMKNNFIKKLPRSIRNDIAKYGIRNAALLTIAPTGTTSLLAGTSSGLEPIFSTAYVRKIVGADDEIVIDPLVVELIKSGYTLDEINEIKTSHDLSPEDHLNIQIVAQDYVDNNISKTIYLPKDFEDDTLPDLLLKVIDDIKGVTLYKDRSREDQPLTPIKLTQEMYDKILTDGNTTIKQEVASKDTCKNGVCDI